MLSICIYNHNKRQTKVEHKNIGNISTAEFRRCPQTATKGGSDERVTFLWPVTGSVVGLRHLI